MPRIKAENPGLRLSQHKTILQKMVRVWICVCVCVRMCHGKVCHTLVCSSGFACESPVGVALQWKKSPDNPMNMEHVAYNEKA